MLLCVSVFELGDIQNNRNYKISRGCVSYVFSCFSMLIVMTMVKMMMTMTMAIMHDKIVQYAFIRERGKTEKETER